MILDVPRFYKICIRQTHLVIHLPVYRAGYAKLLHEKTCEKQ